MLFLVLLVYKFNMVSLMLWYLWSFPVISSNYCLLVFTCQCSSGFQTVSWTHQDLHHKLQISLYGH